MNCTKCNYELSDNNLISVYDDLLGNLKGDYECPNCHTITTIIIATDED